MLRRHARKLAHGLQRDVEILLEGNLGRRHALVAIPSRVAIDARPAAVLRLVPRVTCILVVVAVIVLFVAYGLALDPLHLLLEAHGRPLVLQRGRSMKILVRR